MIKKYLHYLQTTNKKVMLLLTVIFIVIHVVSAFSLNVGNHLRLIDSIIVLVLMFAYAYVFPITLYQKQNKVEGSDVVFALPITRKKRVIAEMIHGWIIIFVPFLISCVVVTIFSPHSIETNFSLWPTYMFYVVIVTAIYLFNSLIVMKCNCTKDAIIVEVLYLFTFIVMFTRISLFLYESSFNETAYQLIYDKVDVVIALINPIAALFLKEYYLIIVYLILSVIIIYFILKTLEKKKVEQVEDVTTSLMTYPFILGALVSLILLTSMTKGMSLNKSLSLYIFLFFSYIALNFVAQRKFKLKLRHVLLFVLSICISYGIRIAFIQSEGMGSATTFREDKEVKVQSIVYETYFDMYDASYIAGAYDRKFSVDAYDNNRKAVYKAAQEIQEFLLNDYKKSWNVLDNSSVTVSNIQIYYNKDNEFDKHSYALDKKQESKLFEILKKYQLDEDL